MTRIILSVAGGILLAAGAFGQMEAGEPLPPFELTLADGSPLRVAVEGGRITVHRGDRVEQPRALMVHFLQPDCLQCQAQLRAMETLHASITSKGGSIVGAAHRGDLDQVRALPAKVAVSFPIGLLTSRAGLEKKVGGDACAIVDEAGIVRFAQAGFGEGDQALWSGVFDALLAGRPSPHATVARERFKAGDVFPAIRLPSLRTGRAMEYVGVDGKLRFTDEDGKQTRPKGAIFFFSRY
jgi:hypothetical protein